MLGVSHYKHCQRQQVGAHSYVAVQLLISRMLVSSPLHLLISASAPLDRYPIELHAVKILAATRLD